MRIIYFKMIKKAINLAAKVHKSHVHQHTKLPYLVHCLGVANHIRFYYDSDMKIDVETLMIVGILHHTLEDFQPPYTKESLSKKISKKFGEQVLQLVCELTNDKNDIAKVGDTEYLKKKLNSMSIEALFVQFCDIYDHLLDSRKDKSRATAIVNILNVLDKNYLCLACLQPILYQIYELYSRIRFK